MNTTKGANSPKKPTAKLPRARVMWQDPSGSCWLYAGTCKTAAPVAVIPGHTPAQARQIVKAAPFLQLSEGEKESALVWEIYETGTLTYADSRVLARAVLAAMGLGGGK